MRKFLDDIQEYLSSKKGASIDVFDFKTNESFYKKLTIEGLKKSDFESFADLIDYLNRTFDTSVFGIQRYKSNGSSNKRFGTTTQLNITRGNQQHKPEEKVVSEAAKGAINNQHISAPSVSTVQPSVIQTQQPSPIGMASAFGMSMPDVMNLNTKASKYDDLIKEHNELKERNKKLEQKNDAQALEIRELKMDLKLAERLKEIDIKERDLKDKPAIDPEIFSRLLDVAENVGATVMANKTGATAAGMAAAETFEELSQNKQDLIYVIKSESVTDEMAKELALVAVGFSRNAEFTTAIRKSIQEFKINELV
ncbi:conserved protein of unknown function [Tenacibaculum sp. 190130A14a]|uniref:Uncharacterized protein n=1 Tax=Tenacibaculum polynesiense TaxID=3137857 RepID=A0ABP1F1T6_9FLAO